VLHFWQDALMSLRKFILYLYVLTGQPGRWTFSHGIKLGAIFLLLWLVLLVVSTARLPSHEAAFTPLAQLFPQSFQDYPSTVRFPTNEEPSPFDADTLPSTPTSDFPHLRSELSPDIQRIVERGSLVVAVLAHDNPPFFQSRGSTTLEGLDIEIAEAIAAYLGVGLQFNRSGQTFDEVVDEVYHLEADMAISKVSRTLKRARRIRFSKPYVSLGQGLLMNRLTFAKYFEMLSQDVPVPMLVNQLEGKIGVLRGSSYVGFVKNTFPRGIVTEYDTWPDLVQAVIRGEVLAACRDELEIKKVLLTQPNAILQMRTISLNYFKDQIAIALPWDSQHLLAFVNQYLEAAELEYTADSLLNDYTEMMDTNKISFAK